MALDRFIKVVLVSAVVLALCPSPIEPTLGDLLTKLSDVNGGGSCMGCTFLTGLGRNFMKVYGFNSSQAIDYFIDCFPEPWHAALALIEPVLIAALNGPMNSNTTPDVACYGAGYCNVTPGYHYCNLYDLPTEGMSAAIDSYTSEYGSETFGDLCSRPEFGPICDLIFLGDPVVIDDPDGDNFTTHPTLRGYAWRGQDCAENNSDIYPGRLPVNSDRDYDSNCNGIWGVNPVSGNAYEDELCGGQSNYGLIYIGDSIGAHFHIPPDWFRANVVTSDLMTNLTFIAANELDWPHLSWGTGFVNSTWPVTINSPTNSMYWRLRDRNRCNHRDYQNLAFNGAQSTTTDRGVHTMTRDEGRDKPVIVIYAEFGNDICGSGDGSVSGMTPVKEFHDSVVRTLDYMETRLPANSHVFLTGLVNGSYLYNIMKGHLHPIGEINSDVYYDNIYNYFGCMQTVCPPWTNTNTTIQDAATDYAMLLSSVLSDIAAASNYTRFDVHYIPCPMEQGMALWDGPLVELIEPIDGLHPSKNGQDLFAEVSWQIMTTYFADILGPVNPNNDLIEQLFGDQGGH